MTTTDTPALGVPAPQFEPAADVLSGETADVYFERARTILAAEGLDPVVTMEIFPRADAVLCGAEEALAYLRQIFGQGAHDPDPVVESLHDGAAVARKEVVMRITARYSGFGSRRRNPSSRSGSSSTTVGAPVIGSRPAWFFGNACVSRITGSARSAMSSRSIPEAIPP